MDNQPIVIDEIRYEGDTQVSADEQVNDETEVVLIGLWRLLIHQAGGMSLSLRIEVEDGVARPSARAKQFVIDEDEMDSPWALSSLIALVQMAVDGVRIKLPVTLFRVPALEVTVATAPTSTP